MPIPFWLERPIRQELVAGLPDHSVARAVSVDRRLDVNRGGLGRAASRGKNAQDTKTSEPQFTLTCHA
jgi:hypothetical protein